MQIAINARSILLNQRTGIGRYTYHLLDSLGTIDADNEYICHVPKRFFDFKRHLPDFSKFKNFKNRVDYFHQGIAKCDIYHLPCPGTIVPYNGKLIVTIHDMIYKTFPQGHTSHTIEMTEKYMQAITVRADYIICISENTRQDLHNVFDIPPEKTGVVYNGVDHTKFYPLSSEEQQVAAAQIKSLGVQLPYVLYVGTVEPRKNLAGLLESFALLKAKNAFQGQLVVAGMKGWMTENISTMIKDLGIDQDVIFTGYISDTQLCQLYNMAEVFVFPSFYEGFGFPILEAFCCGVPVITSTTSSCGEIAGDAALRVNPKDKEAIAHAMEKILTDKVVSASLRQAGLNQANKFSFTRTAEKTLDVYRKICI